MQGKEIKQITFYIVAHADDWQLFMNPNVFLDLMDEENKVVIIITTAGDAGLHAEYWISREQGCKSSVRFCLAPHSPFLCEEESTKNINAHSIRNWRINNVSCYFMRLPDGNIDGRGFISNQHASLGAFKAGNITSLTSLDNANFYESWEDFCCTLNEIVEYESAGITNVWINYQNPDSTINYGDHADHLATGEAVQAMKVLSSVRQVLFKGYSNNATEKVSPDHLFWKVGMLSAYEKAVCDICGYSTLRENISLYIQWCFKSADFIMIYPKENEIITLQKSHHIVSHLR